MKLPLALVPVFCLGSAAAQALTLGGAGGSYPGTLQLRLEPGPIGMSCAIFLGSNSGPVPLAALDPRDPRTLSVGPEFLGLAMPGVFLPPGQFVAPALPVPDDPSLLDAVLFFQGVDFPGPVLPIGRVSNPAVARFAPAGSWRDRGARLTADRSFATVLPDGGGGWMAAGGGLGGISANFPVKSTEVYDVLADVWRPGPLLTTERSLHTATELADGRYLLAGGIDIHQAPQASCEIWDPAAGTFSAAAPMLFKRAGHQATLLPSGRVLVTGGFGLSGMPGSQVSILLGALVETELYDPVTDSWTRGPDMTVPRIQHEQFFTSDGNILIAGGAGWVMAIVKIPALFRDCDVYDPVANTIRSGPPMNEARGGYSVVALDANRFLIAGGGKLSLLNPGAPTAAAEIYDARSKSWSAAGAMTQARTLHRAFAIGGGRFLHAGGVTGNLAGFVALASTDVYDDNTGRWSSGPSMPVARAAAALHVTPLGQVQLISGEGPNAQGLFSSVFYYP